MRPPALLPALLLAAPLSAQQPPAGQPPPALRAVVTPAAPTISVGDTIQLRAEVRDSAGRPVAGARVLWSFGGSPFEGSVDSTGRVVAGATGTLAVAAIPVAADGRLARPTPVHVRIVAPPAARIAVSPERARLVVGQRLTLDATVLAANGDRREDPVRWSSSAPAVASVGGDGQAEGVAPGQATLTAESGAARTSVAVEVVPDAIRRVEITGGGDAARTGDVLTFAASPRDAGGRELAGLVPRWSIAPGSGQIEQTGTFVAYEPGTYTVTASYGVAAAERVVRVQRRDVRRRTTTVGRLPIAGVPTAEFWPHPNGRNAYLATLADRLYALDISDPSNIRITDSVMVDARIINDVMATADGRWAVMTRENASSRRNGIVILSLEDPAHPKPVADYTETVTGGVHSAFVYTQPRHGTHVYLTDDATGSMRVIDLNDPMKPREIARWETGRETSRSTSAGRVLHDIDVRDGLAYLSYWNDGLVILDVGNGAQGGSPQKPMLVAQFKYPLDDIYHEVEAEGGAGFIRGTHTAWRTGKYVFVGDEVFTADPKGIQIPGFGLGKANGRLHVIDVSDIASPRSVAYYEPKDGGVHNVWVAGDTLYLGDYQGGLRVLDISGELRGDLLAQGREIAHVHTGDARGHVPNAAMAWGAFYHNGLVWVNDVFSGLWAVRIEPKAATPPVP